MTGPSAFAIEIRDRSAIEKLLRRHADLHLYALGDLDDFFFADTSFFVDASPENQGDVLLLYRGGETETLLGLTVDDPAGMAALIRSIYAKLPDRVYAHLTPGVAEHLGDVAHIEPHGTHQKMSWSDRSRVEKLDVSNVVPLDVSHRSEVEAFYAACYPGHWFVPRMLETNQYVGIREGNELVSVAGVHVVSERYRVAALGNVATHPNARGRGLAKRACAFLCRRLSGIADTIGLNVESTNLAAVRCYESVGFELVAPYEEALLERKT